MGHKKQVALPTHVHKVTARGKTYYYYQRGRNSRGGPSKRVRIYGEPTDPAWWIEYAKLADLPPPKENPNSFDTLIAKWQASPEYRGLAQSTQYKYRRYCMEIADIFGDLNVSIMEPRHVLALRDRFSKTPSKSDRLISCLSAMLSWSVPRGFRLDNPCREIKSLRSSDGYRPWPMETVERARKDMRPHIWLAAEVALYTGQRLSDVLSMRRDAWQDGYIYIKQKKTGKALGIPVHKQLDAILASIDHNAATFCVNVKGRPWGMQSFQMAWNREKPHYLVEQGLVFHGLRKTAVVTLLEAGCTTAQVAAITGQSWDIVEHYARDVNQKKLAKTAIKLWEDTP